MKKLFFFSFIALGLLTFSACGDDDTSAATEHEYHAHIITPEDNSTFMQGDMVNIKIDFEDHNGNTVHNIAVRIYNKADGTEILNETEHVHAETGEYTYEKDFMLMHSEVAGHSDWILEAKVWGHMDGEGEEISTHEFHVHPSAGSDYHIHIHSPNTDDKNVGDEFMLHVEVEDHNGATIHHVNVKIYNKADNSEVLYDGPADAHVHQDGGSYELMESIKLDVEGHTDWIVEAKAWGHMAGMGEVMETLEFHVHP